MFAASPLRLRVPLISILSIIFYAAWRWDFVFLVVLSSAVDYFAALLIGQRKKRRHRKLILYASLAINLGLLVFFKYTQFLYDSVYNLAVLYSLQFGVDNPIPPYEFNILLPIGISFYTFQSISYTVDVYRGNMKPTRNFTVFFAYVSFWPQLIAGPILRASEVIPQLLNPQRPSRQLFLSGLQRVIIGLAKKVVVADTLAMLVDKMFAQSPEEIALMQASEVWLAAFLFGFQIYMDFSAYSDIAIGSARMVGIKFPENFNWPYMAKSPRDFWQRWHISLSSWIRDYIYLPFMSRRPNVVSTGGLREDDRGEIMHRLMALYFTWLLMGLWHGAGWTFALWGLYHASLILGYRFLAKLLSSWDSSFRSGAIWSEFTWVMTLFPVMASWLFFRAQSTEQLFAFLSRLIDPQAYLIFSNHRLVYFAVCIGLIVAMRILHHAHQPVFVERLRAYRTIWLSGTVAFNASIIFSLIVFLRPIKQFIYFQF